MTRRPAVNTVAAQRTRHLDLDPEGRRRREPSVARNASIRSHLERGYIRAETRTKPRPRPSGLREVIEHNLLQISAILLFVGSVGWCCFFYSQFRPATGPTPTSFAAYALASFADADIGNEKSDVFNVSSYARSDGPQVELAAFPASGDAGGESAASIIAREWKLFAPTRDAAKDRVTVKVVKFKAPAFKQPIRVASLDNSVPQVAMPSIAPIPSRIPSNIEAKTSLVDFATAPFPYHGMMPGTDRPFLNAGGSGHRGHVNFRGRVLWESSTFSDDRVLLHIPPGFDPKRPAVMVVYFHGHGADLAHDVRDRQQLPAQITAAKINAVLVAPQFAVDAADSSAGKFWEAGGFKRFLDEAGDKLARLYGDPRIAPTFANMPIVLVAYSGGFGPALSVLDRGGIAKSRLRGIVLMDALYAGIDTFANWIADNRSAFFISSYTTHTAHHNADLEHLLNARSVPYGSEIRRNHLNGMVAFLPEGDISHRDFVNHAWADNPIKDLLVRMDDTVPRIETASTAGTTASIAPALAASKRN